MQRSGPHLRLSPTDLSNHLACRHLTTLNRSVADGERPAPVRTDPRLEALFERGLEHERAYLDHLRAEGREIVEIGAADPETGFDRTLAEMRGGAEVIAQAVLLRGDWGGRADVLLRVPLPSDLGAYSYEALDTKLARETRAGTILQLAVYTDIIAGIQGVVPEAMHVVPPGEDFAPESFRTADYLAYYRQVRRRLEAGSGQAEPTYPEPVEFCEVCRWWAECRDRRRADDHLSLVAGISRLQRTELRSRGLGTLAALGDAPLPFGWTPDRGSAAAYVHVREQARVQLEARRSGSLVHELLEFAPGQGLARLPEPSRGDIFFDFEGDPFVPPSGLEYLFGWLSLEEDGWTYRCLEALDPAAERRAFETFVDMLAERTRTWPGFHVYHYAPYETSALKRLMGRHATREDEVDDLLRSGVFVDLYAVVRQGLRASVERYSIKDLEPFFGYAREEALPDASRAMRSVEVALELGDAESVDPEALAVVRAYNADDCRAARGLRDWLEALRSEAIAGGADLVRPEARAGEPPEDRGEWLERVRPVRDRLHADVPADPGERTAAEHARWVLGHIPEFHRREEKAPWWNYFRLIGLTDAEYAAEGGALGGLRFLERLEAGDRPLDRYAFPPQETKLRPPDPLHTPDGERVGTLEELDAAASTLDIRKTGKTRDLHPASVFGHSVVGGQVKAEALLRMAAWVAEHGIEADGAFRAGRDLLLRHPPRFAGGGTLGEGTGDLTLRAGELGLALSDSVLAIQGPPGAGKTYTAATMAVELLRAGKTVGVTAPSHKVVGHLLAWILERAGELGVEARCLQKVGSGRREAPADRLRQVSSNPPVERALARGTENVIGGTSWLWARPELAGAVDVLFIDEAGQLSLADAVAVSQAARSVVLVGDPAQLEQPLQGSHPEGTAISALEHMLDGRRTMPPDRGLFMSRTRRLAPAICRFTSEVFYEGRLGALEGLGRQELLGGPLPGAGLWVRTVEHEGCQNASPAEVAQIVGLFGELTGGGASWVDFEGTRRVLGPGDVLIVAPYNAQVSDLARALPGARVGTVDRFQGQEAPVVICSMTTSSPEDAPHGMEFLYSLNRLNVATSRARCAAVLVASPRLFEPDCRTPRQMQLANAFCRYLELAREV